MEVWFFDVRSTITSLHFDCHPREKKEVHGFNTVPGNGIVLTLKTTALHSELTFGKLGQDAGVARDSVGIGR